MSDWVVYGRRTCSFTINAMNLLRSRNIPFDFRDVSDNSARTKIIQKSGMNTVPVIYKGARLIGGFSELQRYLGAR